MKPGLPAVGHNRERISAMGAREGALTVPHVMYVCALISHGRQAGELALRWMSFLLPPASCYTQLQCCFHFKFTKMLKPVLQEWARVWLEHIGIAEGFSRAKQDTGMPPKEECCYRRKENVLCHGFFFSFWREEKFLFQLPINRDACELGWSTQMCLAKADVLWHSLQQLKNRKICRSLVSPFIGEIGQPTTLKQPEWMLRNPLLARVPSHDPVLQAATAPGCYVFILCLSVRLKSKQKI